MTTTAEEAAQALHEIALIRHRAAGFQDYQAESGQLLLWGLAYVVGFALTACFRDQLIPIWAGIVSLTTAIGTWLASRTGADGGRVAGRYLAVIGTILLFCLALNIIFWPLTPEQGAMLAPMLLAALYILRGIQLRPRYLVIGLLLGGLCLGGYVLLLPVFWPWMTLACGGTLIVSGLWLRAV